MKLLIIHTNYLDRTMTEAIKKETMKTMKKDYSEGYEERNNEDYEERL